MNIFYLFVLRFLNISSISLQFHDASFDDVRFFTFTVNNDVEIETIEVC